MAEPKSFVVTMKEFFGLKPDQSLMDFTKELKALSESDRNYFKNEFLKIGIVVA